MSNRVMIIIYIRIFRKQNKYVLTSRNAEVSDPTPVCIKGEKVERVSGTHTHKYLGVVFDNKLCWNENTSSIIKKVNTRVYLTYLDVTGVESGLDHPYSQMSSMEKGVLFEEALLATFYNAVLPPEDGMWLPMQVAEELKTVSYATPPVEERRIRR